MNMMLKQPNNGQAKLYMLLSFSLGLLLAGILLRNTQQTYNENLQVQYNESMINSTTTERRKIRKEYLYRLLTNTTRSLIQMEIKARRLEENMRRIKEKTADLLWKKDKALWHILFKNISRNVALRHEFHQHSSLKRIMLDSSDVHRSKHRTGNKKSFLSR